MPKARVGSRPADRKALRGWLGLAMLLPLPLLVMGSCVYIFYSNLSARDLIIQPGVHLFSLDLGGKTFEEARDAIQKWAQDRANSLITLKVDGLPSKSPISIRARTLGLGVDVEETLQAAEQAGKMNVLQKVADILHPQKADYPINPTLSIDQKQLHMSLTHIAHLIQIPPANAQIVLLPRGGFGLKHEVPGRALDVNAAASLITNAWSQFNKVSSTGSGSSAEPTTSSLNHLDISVPSQILQPSITYEMLHSIDGKLASYSTWYAEGRRGDNIEVAAEKINGTLLMPGQIFSFNKTVGPRALSAGFKIAPVIIYGKLQPGVGGGICQVSGTLYNAALEAGLKTVVRNHHSFPVSDGGIPTGRDATVAYGQIDMQFQNTLPYPIYIVGRAQHGKLTFVIFGHVLPDRQVELVRVYRHESDIPVEIIHDPLLPVGRRIVEQEGRPTVRTTWYQIVRENGRIVSKDIISSHYQAQPRILRIGVKPRGAPAAPVSSSPRPPIPNLPNP